MSELPKIHSYIHCLRCGQEIKSHKVVKYLEDARELLMNYSDEPAQARWHIAKALALLKGEQA